MEILFAFIPVILIGGMFYLLIMTLISAARLEGAMMIVWIHKYINH